MGWQMARDAEPTRTLLGTLAAALFTFIVFVCSSLLLVVQLASAQMSPRVIANMFRDRVIKFSLAVFVFSFTFLLAALIRIESAVPLVLTRVAVYSSVASVAAFLYLVEHVGKMLRPSGVFALVAS